MRDSDVDGLDQRIKLATCVTLIVLARTGSIIQQSILDRRLSIRLVKIRKSLTLHAYSFGLKRSVSLMGPVAPIEVCLDWQHVLRWVDTGAVGSVRVWFTAIGQFRSS